MTSGRSKVKRNVKIESREIVCSEQTLPVARWTARRWTDRRPCRKLALEATWPASRCSSDTELTPQGEASPAPPSTGRRLQVRGHIPHLGLADNLCQNPGRDAAYKANRERAGASGKNTPAKKKKCIMHWESLCWCLCKKKRSEGNLLPEDSERRMKKQKKKIQSTPLQACVCSLWRTLRLCVAGHSECIEPLVQHGADVDHHIERTGSPLHAACSNQHADAARKLLQLGEEQRGPG